MGDIVGIPTFSGLNSPGRQAADAAASSVQPVATDIASDGASGRMDQSGHQSRGDPNSMQYRTPQALIVPLPKAEIDGHTIPGPPPAFQVSQLELDAHLLKSLAQMNAAHAMSQDEYPFASVELPSDPAADPFELAPQPADMAPVDPDEPQEVVPTLKDVIAEDSATEEQIVPPIYPAEEDARDEAWQAMADLEAQLETDEDAA